MTWVVPDEIEAALHAAATARLPARVLKPAALAAAVVDRSRRYTSERERLATPGDADGDLAARALFFTVADVAKVGLPLVELEAQRGLPDGALAVVDVGAGAGAMSLGVVAWLAATGRQARCAPPSSIATPARSRSGATRCAPPGPRSGSRSRRRWWWPTSGAPRCRPPTSSSPARCSTSCPRRRRLPSSSALAAARHAAIVIEPALRETARALHALRDAVLAGGRAAVVAPCTHDRPCPMLADPRDWCHEVRPARLPARTRALAAATGLRDGDLKFAYLVLAPSPAPTTSSTPGWRVVSEPLRPKGKLELFMCGADGRRRLRLLDRHAGPGPTAVRALVRGDLVALAPAPDERGTIAADVEVSRVHRAWPG
ncbi:MAG: small ribosomal subunit Rsm22 family protein [Kofleriaceae bacterium]